jgi:hypothetical protein
MKKQINPAKITVTLLNNAADIDKAIKSIANRGKVFERDLHNTAMSCLVHADKHGDVTLATRLLTALPNTTRKNALRDWFLAFGKFDYDMKSKAFTYGRDKVSLIDDAAQMPFWVFQPEKETAPFDLSAAIARLLKQAEGAQAKGNDVDLSKLNALRSIVEVQVQH